jgi:hypothetical protein
MEKDLLALMLRINVNGTKQIRARQRRLVILNKQSREIIRTAFSEINAELKKAARRIAKVEARRTNEIVENNLP